MWSGSRTSLTRSSRARNDRRPRRACDRCQWREDRMGTVTSTASAPALDTPEVRKARGAFFTPEPIARFIAEWAIRSSDERVLEPSCGDAEFLEHAVTRLRELGAEGEPVVSGVEIHA